MGLKFKRYFFFQEDDLGDDLTIVDMPDDYEELEKQLMESSIYKKSYRVEGRTMEGYPWLIKDARRGKLPEVAPMALTWDDVPWTSFEEGTTDHYPEAARPHRSFMNSIYQVSLWYQRHPTFGELAHLSFKTHDRAPRHDWREMQWIKNELCGKEAHGIEMYPPESRVVDTANQYHLFVFRTFRFEGIGFTERLVSEGSGLGSKQRPWRKELRPHDLTSEEKMVAVSKAYLTRNK